MKNFTISQQLDLPGSDMAGNVKLYLKGEISSFSKEVFSQQRETLQRTKPDELVLNFSEVEHITGSGLKFLTIFCTQIKLEGTKIEVEALNDHLRAIFQLTKLFHLFHK